MPIAWKEAWPSEWVSITLLKPDLRRSAREMESRLAVEAPAPAVAGHRRSWAGLGWEGADEGLLRRGRSRRARVDVHDARDGLGEHAVVSCRQCRHLPFRRVDRRLAL